MTLQDIYRKTENELAVRRNLSEEELKKRLENYYNADQIKDIIASAKAFETWTDGNIVIVYTGIVTFIGNVSMYNYKIIHKFVAIADGRYIKLIEP